MKTVILAAGVGQRLGEYTGNRPKCLLEFAGKSLLQRHLVNLQHHGITDIILVTGFMENLIIEQVKNEIDQGIIQTVHNPEFRKGSVISLMTGLGKLDAGEDFILMDADVLYDHRIIERLLNTRHRNCFLLDREFEQGEEPVKLCVLDGQLIEFRKKIDDNLRFDYQGESVGFFRFTGVTAEKLVQVSERYLDRGDVLLPYEECIRDLLLENPDQFGFEDITELAWIEIDFPEDIDRAKKNILPCIPEIQ